MWTEWWRRYYNGDKAWALDHVDQRRRSIGGENLGRSGSNSCGPSDPEIERWRLDYEGYREVTQKERCRPLDLDAADLMVDGSRRRTEINARENGTMA